MVLLLPEMGYCTGFLLIVFIIGNSFTYIDIARFKRATLTITAATTHLMVQFIRHNTAS